MPNALRLLFGTGSAAASAGIYFALKYLPPVGSRSPWPPTAMSSTNWMGQSAGVAYALGGVLLVIIYVAKFIITRLTHSTPVLIAWYCLLVALSLPCIWFFVDTDWWNPFVYRLACWVGLPVGIWLVPTYSLWLDASAAERPSLRQYCWRSVVELLLLVPVFVVALNVLMFVIGWGWI
jgi:hypothetical protein